MAEPRSANVEWRWVNEPIDGNPDNCRNVLIETTWVPADPATGKGVAKVDRKILECGNIDAEDMDRIEVVPSLEVSCYSLAADCEELRIAIDLAIGLLDKGCTLDARRALTNTRGEGRPDA